MSNSIDSTISDFVARQRILLEQELQAEQEVEQQASTNQSKSNRRSDDASAYAAASSATAVVLRDLEVSEVSVGLYGRTVVTLITSKKVTSSSTTAAATSAPTPPATKTTTIQEQLLPAHRFTVGGEVEIRSSQKDTASGVVSAVADTSISIALFSKKKRNDNKNNKNDKSDNGGNDDADDDVLGPPPLMMVPKSAMEVHRKLMIALDQLAQHGMYHPIAGKVVEACFSSAKASTAATVSVIDCKSHDSSSTSEQLPSQALLTALPSSSQLLDASQQEAIRFCLLSPDRPVTLCHGPPGTGKTTTMAELIRQAVHEHHMKVLVTAPSNVAVDNILERLVTTMSRIKSSSLSSKRKAGAGATPSASATPMRVVRLGHPARIKQSILPYSLESLVYHAEGTEIVAEVRQELQAFLQILTNNGKRKARGIDRKVAYHEVKRLRQEIKQREEKVVHELISKAQVVLATTVGAANSLLRRYVPDGFDLVIIDEAAQALEASCWIPALQGKRLVLAGDHCQLPPTIQNEKVQKELGKTMFERIMELYGNDDSKSIHSKEKADVNRGVGRVSRMLQVQYRMHESIANWASKAMYGGKLQTHESVQKRVLADLMVVQQAPSSSLLSRSKQDQVVNKVDDGDDDMSKTTLLWIDTAGCELHESVNDAGSRYNEGEAQLVAQHVQTLLHMGIKATDIAIITPYNGQVELLRSILLSQVAPNLEIRSVDGFQGGEREAVVLSLVRSSERNSAGGGSGIGFLRDDRRLNVAVTRAKRHCAVIGDSETVCQSNMINSLFRWIEDYGEQRSAMEYLSGDNEVHVHGDLRDAQTMLRKIMAESASFKNAKSATSKKLEEQRGATKRPVADQAAEEEKRKVLLDKISTFAETGSNGEEMLLSTELSRYDRKVVHEFATELGLGHTSQGTEGVDRRIVLTIIPRAAPALQSVAVASGVVVVLETIDPDEQTPAQSSDGHNVEVPSSKEKSRSTSAFAALDFDDDDDDEESKSSNDDEAQRDSGTLDPPKPPINNVLRSLARAERERNKSSLPAVPGGPSEMTKKSSKPKGHKLGGSKRTTLPTASSLEEDELLDDDVAFLNAQMARVQTSHGRRVDGQGNNYRTIVNGILIAKPPPRIEESKNKQAVASLQSKLKKAQEERRAKSAKKKK